MNSLLHIYAVYLGKVHKVPHIGYGIHEQTSGYQKKAQKTARNAFRLGVRNFGTASQLTANKQPPLAPLNNTFSY